MNGVPGEALNLNSANHSDHGHHGDPPLSGKNPHGRAGNRTRDLMISFQKRWPLDHEAGLDYKDVFFYFWNARRRTEFISQADFFFILSERYRLITACRFCPAYVSSRPSGLHEHEYDKRADRKWQPMVVRQNNDPLVLSYRLRRYVIVQKPDFETRQWRRLVKSICQWSVCSCVPRVVLCHTAYIKAYKFYLLVVLLR
jgi:hypothetical protein